MKFSAPIGRRTIVDLEDAFWDALADIARRSGRTVPEIVATVHRTRQEPNLWSALRAFALEYYRRRRRFAPLPRSPWSGQ